MRKNRVKKKKQKKKTKNKKLRAGWNPVIGSERSTQLDHAPRD
jgi:hypothetical protein